MANLSSMLEQAAADHRERPAVRMDDLVLSFEELRDAAARVASLLSSFGIAPGDRVGVMLPNVPAFPIAFYGALAAGAVEVREPDLAGLLAGVGPAPAIAKRSGDDDAVILYTSGTTGRPKGAELTHAGLLRNAELTARTLLKNDPDDVMMGCLPLFHVFGLT